MSHLKTLKEKSYKNRLNNLPNPSGALVFYSALKKEDIKKTSNHYQFVSKEFNSLFVSISDDGDEEHQKVRLLNYEYLYQD